MTSLLPRCPEKLRTTLFLAGLAVATVLIQGYHPYAEDGGVYTAGIKHLLNPGLYPRFTDFVTAPTRFSLFAPAMAGLVHLLHLSLPVTLLLVYIASTWLLLYAGWLLASCCIASWVTRAAAVTALAIGCGLPVAGTALMIMDPYVTARSLTTPLILLAVAMAMKFRRPERRAWALIASALCLCLAASLHPLMAAYGLGFVLLLLCGQMGSMRARLWSSLWLCVAALAAAVIAQGVAVIRFPATTAYTVVVLTRYYWFLSEWHWYEIFGLFAPLLIVAATDRLDLLRASPALRVLSDATMYLGVTAILVAFICARTIASAYFVARLQPLRCFQMVYVIMLLLLGAFAAELWKHTWIQERNPGKLAVTAVVVLTAAMFLFQFETYPSSLHLEAPWRAQRNPWAQAFLWIRQNTPLDTLFALDADYITTTGEDAQCFRTIAERSALPDYSKDGGEASIGPDLTSEWTIGSNLQDGLSLQTDIERSRRLLPVGVSWSVLKNAAHTKLNCPYHNSTVKVCRLR